MSSGVTALAASCTNITWWHRFSAPTGRDGQHRAPGVRQAVAADLAVPHPGQRAAPPRADDQQVIGGVRDLDQRRARLAADDDRLDVQVRRGAAPGGLQRAIEPLPGGVRPDAAQGGRGTGRSARSPPGGIHASTATSGTSLRRARCCAYRNARMLPGEPPVPTTSRSRPGTTFIIRCSGARVWIWTSRRPDFPAHLHTRLARTSRLLRRRSVRFPYDRAPACPNRGYRPAEGPAITPELRIPASSPCSSCWPTRAGR